MTTKSGPQDPAVREFNLQLSRALRDFMLDHDIKVGAVAEFLGRTNGYISQRTTGYNALPADIIGAVAVLAHFSPAALMNELTDRMRRAD